MACDWWSEAEDFRPGMGAEIVELHGGTKDEVVIWTCPVRKVPRHLRGRRLVIRAKTGQTVTGADGTATTPIVALFAGPWE